MLPNNSPRIYEVHRKMLREKMASKQIPVKQPRNTAPNATGWGCGAHGVQKQD
jgi:hypothetical protein